MKSIKTEKKKEVTMEDIKRAFIEATPGYNVKMAKGVDREMARLGVAGAYDPTVWEEIWWKIEKILKAPSDYWDSLVRFYQRGMYGYADRDCWDLSEYLASWLPSALRTMVDEKQKGGNTYPGLPYGKEADTFKHWKKTVEKMAQAFEAHQELFDLSYGKDQKKKRQLLKQRAEGLKLFIKYFDHLWD